MPVAIPALLRIQVIEPLEFGPKCYPNRILRKFLLIVSHSRGLIRKCQPQLLANHTPRLHEENLKVFHYL